MGSLASGTPAAKLLLACSLFVSVRAKHEMTASNTIRKLSTLPSFSWETVPVFAETSNVTGPFDEDAMNALSKFQLFVAEKAYMFDYPGFAEDKLNTLGRELRKRNPNMTLIFYYNSNLDLSDYRLHTFMQANAPNFWLCDSDGVPVWTPVDGGAGSVPRFPYNHTHVYNHVVAEVRKIWVAECINMTKLPGAAYDGCMVDRWTRSPKVANVSARAMAQWVQGRDQATAALLAATRENNVYLIGENGKVSPDAISDPGYGYHLTSSLQAQLKLAAAKQGLLASMRPGTTEGAELNNQLSAFLIGAGTNHFFGAGSWTCSHTSREGVKWWPEFDRPLGPPLSDAQLTGTVYTRNFTHGVHVSFDTATSTGAIDWNSPVSA
eukprot:m.329882 g.329882  ORF g.329882 m.329882 type:complete len:379 (-) comp20452_c0_seq2:192-1328(-)